MAADASALNPTEIRQELLRRDVEPTGFGEDDIKVLQKIYDQERQVTMLAQRQNLKADQERREKAAELKRSERAGEREKFEEEDALRRRPDIINWLQLANSSSCGHTAHLSIKPVLARHLAKELPSQCCLTSLDLSRNKLDDNVGVALALMVKRNTSLLKLELRGNSLGVNSARGLADALTTNTTLQALGLEGNPLCNQTAAGWRRWRACCAKTPR